MLSKEEIEENNAFKISMPLITDEDMRKIDNNFENIVKEFVKSYAKEKDLVLAQYVMKKQQDKIDKLESDKQKLIEKLEEDISELEALNDDYTDADIMEGIYITRGQIIKAKEILSILKGSERDG